MKDYFYNELYCLTRDYFETLFNDSEFKKIDIDCLTKGALPHFNDVLCGKNKLLIQCYPINVPELVENIDEPINKLFQINQKFIDQLSYIFHRYKE